MMGKFRREFGDKELIQHGILTAVDQQSEVNVTLTANPNYLLATAARHRGGLIVAGQKSLDPRRWLIVELLSKHGMEHLFRVVTTPSGSLPGRHDNSDRRRSTLGKTTPDVFVFRLN